MTELSTRRSFIVRVYRYDPEDDGKVAGLIEVLDGTGVSTPFRNSVELGDISTDLRADAANSGRNKKCNYSDTILKPPQDVAVERNGGCLSAREFSPQAMPLRPAAHR